MMTKFEADANGRHEAGISVDPKRKKDEEDEEVFAEDERLAQAAQAAQAATA